MAKQMTADERNGLTRRRLLAAGAAAGAGLVLGSGTAVGATLPTLRRVDFSGLRDADAWPNGWTCPGVANLRVSGGRGLLEAGTDVFPSDPRPAAFVADARFVEGSVRAVITAAGSLAGVLLRRTGPRDYYAAFYDVQQGLLSIVRRAGADLKTLSVVPVSGGGRELVLELAAAGASPTTLTATLTIAGAAPLSISARDGAWPLQARGDAGVLGQARTLFPSSGPPVLPALGNFHLLPYGVQEGEVVLATPEGQEVIAEIRRESTVAFREITVHSAEAPRVTPASVIAATTGVPRTGGARLHVASDLPADVIVEVSDTPSFKRPRRVAAGRTGPFAAYTAAAGELPFRRRAYWRATLRRGGAAAVGPVRSFRVLPATGDPAKVRVAIAACAAQFGPLFGDLAKLDPDVFVWQGDLNYPDTAGPLAQTMSGYAGIWRDFLANPVLAPVLERSPFVAVRDDHDYAAQDSNSLTIPHFPWGVAPWDAMLGNHVGYRFSAGLADVWVLDQRRFKSDPAAPDGPRKTLLGKRQREWLLEGLRESTAPFKVICSPCTVFMSANRRDGNWANEFSKERDEILAAIDHKVSGRVIFVTGDTHLTGVYDAHGRFEARPCPLGIPAPNDITLSDPQAADKLRAKPGVVYADDRCHFAVLEVGGHGRTATLDLTLRRDDGTTPYRKTFTQRIPPPALRLAAGRVHDGRIPVRVSLDRPGLVRLRATITRIADRRRRSTRLAGRVVRFRDAGSRRVTLRLSRRSRAALRHSGRWRLNLSARYRSPGGRLTLRRVSRWLRR
jgi:hypothetical protein